LLRYICIVVTPLFVAQPGLVNAAQAIALVARDGKKGKIRITALEGKRDGRRCIVISIADSGPGISPELQQRIFEPFFTTKDVGQGTGQGLPITHSIITQKHGGSIWLESAVGEGTTFYITLPLD
jgi:two-component system NtrC family sensor kinase